MKKILSFIFVVFTSFVFSTNVYGETNDISTNTQSNTSVILENDVNSDGTTVTEPTKSVDEVNAAEDSTRQNNSVLPESEVASAEISSQANDTNTNAAVSKAQDVVIDDVPLWEYQWDMQYVTDNGSSYGLYTPSKNISVAVVDSGIINHIDIESSLGPYLKNFVPKGGLGNNESYEDGNLSSISDIMGHGTEVAGQITANGNMLGVAPGVTINIYRIFGNAGAKADWVAAAIKSAADDGNRIITLSAGQYLMISGEYEDGTNDYQDFLTYKSAIDYATSKGSLVVAALGNDSLNTQDNQAMLDYLSTNSKIKTPGIVVDAPTIFDNVVAVGGIDRFGNISDFSNIAPGAIYVPAGTGENLMKYGLEEFINKGYYLTDWILTTSSTVGYQYVYGNSFAAPKVAGALALIADKYKNLNTPSLLKEYLLSHSPIVNGNKVLNISALLNGKDQNMDVNQDQNTNINTDQEASTNTPDTSISAQESMNDKQKPASQKDWTEQNMDTNKELTIQKDFINDSIKPIDKEKNERGVASPRSPMRLPETGEKLQPVLPFIGFVILTISTVAIIQQKRKF